MSEEKSNSRLVKIGGALIILAACGIMLPAIFQYVAGIGRMVILIVVALAAAYVLNMMMARQAINRMRAKARAAGSEQSADSQSQQKNGNNGSASNSEVPSE